MNFYNRVALLLLILLAFALRAYKLDSQSFWYDEGVSAVVAQYDLPTLTTWTANDIQPPLYYYTLAGWGRVAGWSEWSLRFVSLFWGVLSVPFLAMLALRLARKASAAFFAGFFVTFHPLLVYYSQEARMYTMLVALGIVTGYALLRAQAEMEDNAPSTGWWLLYVGAATASVYTHYFAFFLLLALGLNALLSLTRKAIHESNSTPSRFTSSRFRISRFIPSRLIYANLAILLLYTPWFFALFTRLSQDTSYWKGEFKWWEGLRHVVISFVLGETVLEAAALRWLPLYVAISGVALLMLVLKRRWRTIFFCLIWLILPVLCVLTLAWINPKFNARYAMVALPGLLLLWAVGIAELGFVNPLRSEGRKPAFLPLFRPASALILSLLLTFPFTISLRNWFTDTAFTKDQWRELASYAREVVAPDEKIVLVSGHTWPIWDYYAANLPVIALPQIEILDVDAVLDYKTTAATLKRELGNAKGVWLIRWQDEVVDPNAMTRLILEFGGQEEWVKAQFWRLRFQHYVNFDASKIPDDLPVEMPSGDDFGHQIKLLGNTVLANEDFLMVWQRDPQSPAIKEDLWMSVEVRLPSQRVIKRLSERRLANYLYPTTRWRPGEVVIGRIPAQELLEPGLLSGYQLYITVFDPQGDLAGLDVFDTDGSALGKQSYITYQPHSIPSGATDVSAAQWPQLLPGMHLKPTLLQNSIQAGQRLEFNMQWYLTQLPDGGEHSYWVNLLNQATGEVMFSQPFSTDPLNKVTKDRLNQLLTEPIFIQTNVAPGEALLTITQPQQQAPVLAQVPLTILPPTQAINTPLLATIEGGGFMADPQAIDRKDPAVVVLAGLTKLLPSKVSPEATIDLGLAWQGQQAANYGSLKVTLQLLDANGLLVSQIDEALPSEIDLHGVSVGQNLQLKAPASAGAYRLIAAVYDASVPGLPRLWTSKTQDFLELGEITVSE